MTEFCCDVVNIIANEVMKINNAKPKIEEDVVLITLTTYTDHSPYTGEMSEDELEFRIKYFISIVRENTILTHHTIRIATEEIMGVCDEYTNFEITITDICKNSINIKVRNTDSNSSITLKYTFDNKKLLFFSRSKMITDDYGHYCFYSKPCGWRNRIRTDIDWEVFY